MTDPGQSRDRIAVSASKSLDELLEVMGGRQYGSSPDRQSILVIMLAQGSHREVTWLAAVAIDRLLEAAEAGS